MRSLRPLFVKDALLVSLFPPRVEEGHLRAEEGRILEVGPDARPRGGDDIVDRWGKPVLPGFVNASHHLLGAAAGFRVPPREDLDRSAAAPETLHALAAISLLDALACGTTTVVHHPSVLLPEDGLEALALAFREVGVRGVIGVPFDREGEARAVDAVRRFQAENVDPGVRLAVRVQGARGSSDREALARVRQETGLPLHVDLRGESGEVESGLAALGDAGLLREGTLLFGPATDSVPSLRRALEKGARLAVAPRAEAARSERRSPIEAFPDRVALGTGGVDGDLFEEMRFAALGAAVEGKSIDPVRLAVAGCEVARSAFDLPFGSLSAGAPADLLFVDAIPAEPLRPDRLASFLLDLASRRVETVYVGGRRLYHRREPVVPLEREELIARGRVALAGV